MKVIKTEGDEPLRIKGYKSEHACDIKGEDGKMYRIWVHTKKRWWGRWWVAAVIFAALAAYKIWIGDWVF